MMMIIFIYVWAIPLKEFLLTIVLFQTFISVVESECKRKKLEK